MEYTFKVKFETDSDMDENELTSLLEEQGLESVSVEPLEDPTDVTAPTKPETKSDQDDDAVEDTAGKENQS